MGFNTAVMVLNDRLHEIERDPDFAENLSRAISIAHRDPSRYARGFSVLPPQHADTMQIIAIGGNCMRTLGYGRWDQSDEQLLRTLADQLGFRLVRKKGAPQ